MTHETQQPPIDNIEQSLHMYAEFLAFELREAEGAAFFQIFHPAPENIPIGRLEELAATLRQSGHNAQLTPLESDEESYFGIKIIPIP